ncbi:protein VAPYRIN-like isoform X2 [Homarus americanus]|uniref:protein VAPYRIN-like isoform X2 n=1 Tax=Homarus americanus TaxID=6706 RepID=UPI001C48F967|nr:protein VAPYRIN-like isoform X2 [Homarus americanus]
MGSDYTVHEAAMNGWMKPVKEYLKHGDVNAMYNGWTLLHTACCHGRDKVVKELVNNPHICVNLHRSTETALMMASMKGHKDCIDILMRTQFKCKLDTDAKNSSGNTALDLAFLYKRKDVAFLLMSVKMKDQDSVPSEEKVNKLAHHEK